jgi:hypothetical protein
MFSGWQGRFLDGKAKRLDHFREVRFVFGAEIQTSLQPLVAATLDQWMTREGRMLFAYPAGSGDLNRDIVALNDQLEQLRDGR